MAESTILHQVGPGDLRTMISEVIQEHIKPPEEKKLIPKNKAAKRLKRTVQTLDSWHRAGLLKKKYIGGRVFYNEQDIIRLESSNKC